MSTENNQPDYVPIPDGVKGLKVKIDTSVKDAEISRLNEELGHKNEIIQAYMVSEKNKMQQEQYEAERKKAEEAVCGKKPTICDAEDTAPLYAPKREIFKVDMEGSNVDPSWVKGNSAQEIIQTVEKLSQVAENRDEYEKILSRLGKKVMHSDRPFDYTFIGSNIEFIRHPKQVSEFASSEEKERVERYNAKLLKNRVQWKQGD